MRALSRNTPIFIVPRVNNPNKVSHRSETIGAIIELIVTQFMKVLGQPYGFCYEPVTLELVVTLDVPSGLCWYCSSLQASIHPTL